MSTDALSFCLDLGHAHARLALKLDDDLGAFHGLNFADFTLLYLLLRAEQGRMPMADLACTLGLPMSALIRRMLLLEKTGLAERVAGAGTDHRRHAALRSGGRQLVRDAVVTAEAHCRQAVRAIDQRQLSDAQAVLRAI